VAGLNQNPYMLLWIILVLGWVVVLLLAVSLFRLAAYAERKVRGRARTAVVTKEPEDRVA
jgi:NADH:ubiquinone oxidoreductase subunit H